MLHDIETARLEAIKQLRYRSYLVANVLLRGGIEPWFFDLYLLGDGQLNTANLQAAAQQQQVTDVVWRTTRVHQPYRVNAVSRHALRWRRADFWCRGYAGMRHA